MVLPLILGLMGSGLASAGALGGLGALAAGAIGSGIGSAIEEKDLMAGIQTGLLSFVGGKALGSLMGGASGSALAAGANPALAGTAADVTTQAATQMAGQQAAQQAAGQGGGLKLGKLFGNTFQDPTKGIKASMFGKQLLPYVAGSQLGNVAQMAYKQDGSIPDASNEDDMPEIGKAPPRLMRRPPPGYRPGFDPEFNYMFPTTYAEGGIVALGDQAQQSPQGGVAPEDVQAVAAAIQGAVPDPQRILSEFLQKYGEDVLRQVIDMVMRGDTQQPSQGDGLSDSIPASVDGQQPAKLSEGEFVVPSDVVSDLGNGSTEAGASKLHEMMARVRASRRGLPAQPPRIDPNAMMPA